MEGNSFREVPTGEALATLLVFVLSSLLFLFPRRPKVGSGPQKLPHPPMPKCRPQCVTQTPQDINYSAQTPCIISAFHPGTVKCNVHKSSRRRGPDLRAPMLQLRAKATRLQPGPPCLLSACALEPLPGSSMVSRSNAPSAACGEATWVPSPASLSITEGTQPCKSTSWCRNLKLGPCSAEHHSKPPSWIWSSETQLGSILTSAVFGSDPAVILPQKHKGKSASPGLVSHKPQALPEEAQPITRNQGDAGCICIPSQCKSDVT